MLSAVPGGRATPRHASGAAAADCGILRGVGSPRVRRAPGLTRRQTLLVGLAAFTAAFAPARLGLARTAQRLSTGRAGTYGRLVATLRDAPDGRFAGLRAGGRRARLRRLVRPAGRRDPRARGRGPRRARRRPAARVRQARAGRAAAGGTGRRAARGRGRARGGDVRRAAGRGRAPGRPGAVDGAVSAHLRRIIDFGPGSGVYPGSATTSASTATATTSPRRTRRGSGCGPTGRACSRCATIAIDDPANPGAPRLQALDEQIAAAVADGVRVLLCPIASRRGRTARRSWRGRATRTWRSSFGARGPHDRRRAWRALRRRRAATRAASTPSRRGLEFHVPPDGVGARQRLEPLLRVPLRALPLGGRRSGRASMGSSSSTSPTSSSGPSARPRRPTTRSRTRR